MRIVILGVAAMAALAACSGGDSAPPKVEEVKAASLQPGEYEVTATVAALRSTDQTTPATKAKVGDPPKTMRTCVASDGMIEAAAFVEAGEKCNAMDNYMRSGRMSLQYKCTRGSEQVTQLVDGDFTADSFQAKVTTATYFTGSGDYELTRTFAGKRVGECPAATEAAKP